MTPFTHLHVHTQYSLLDGAAKIPDLIARAKELGQTALAITDHGNMYGVIEFYKACQKEGIKPILGMEAYITSGSMLAKSGSVGRDYAHLILLAKNDVGYHNLTILSSEAFLHGFYYKPRIDYDLLEQYHEGLICMSACLAGDIPQALLQNNYDRALSFAKRLKGMFGDDFYIELQNHGIEEQIRILPGLRQIARDIGAKTVVTNDSHYVRREDAEAQDVLLCIQTKRYVDEPDRMRMGSDEFYLKSGDEMAARFPDDPDALATTNEIADKCNVEIKFGIRRQPKYDVPEGYTNETYLRAICEDGLQKKLGGGNETYRKRLDYELSVINGMGFTDYFLIVWDYVHFAKTHGIVVGPGRGSAAGSLVAYTMDITVIDPLKYNLLFERFLNPERVTMPDIDVDFCDEGRQDVIDYVTEKYGEGRVSQIITFGTMAARQVLRDVGRALRIPFQDTDKLAKLVPTQLNMTLTQALSISPELKNLYDTDETMHRVIELSLKLEGLPRQSSTHASGVVISGIPITDVVPLQVNDTVVTTQFTMTTIEELGMLKMDFLGLRTLTVISDALRYIDESGLEAPDFTSQDFTDPAIYDMITRGDTDGVFQLESAGMRAFQAQLKPDCFEDIIAGISLYRPGPMEQIPRYVKGKHDPSSVTYAHPLLKPILENTYGCMVYQEQVMEIVRSLGGYSYGRSDLVRRAMAKKKHDVMAKEREYFIHGTDGVEGALKRGVPEATANAIFDEMMDFASYAFNKSHAAVYAVLAYRTAYLKCHYPLQFMTALTNSFTGNADKIAEYVYSARHQGISVLPPDVNHSKSQFSVEGKAIRFGLSAVKSVGEGAMDKVVAIRNAGGPFKSFFDFCDRCCLDMNKRMLEALISAGCFDSMGLKRSQLLAVYDQAFDSAVQARKVRDTGQLSLFDTVESQEIKSSVSIRIPDIPELDRGTLLQRERDSLGMYLSGHPLDSNLDILKKQQYSIMDLQEADGVTGIQDNADVTVGGMLTACKQKPTRSGSGIMGYATLEGITGSVECVLFPRTLQQYSKLFHDDSRVLVSGKLNIREDRTNSLLIDKLSALEDVSGKAEQPRKVLWIRLNSFSNEEFQKAILFLQSHGGKTPVILFDNSTRARKAAPPSLSVSTDEGTLRDAEALFGKDNVKLK